MDESDNISPDTLVPPGPPTSIVASYSGNNIALKWKAPTNYSNEYQVYTYYIYPDPEPISPGSYFEVYGTSYLFQPDLVANISNSPVRFLVKTNYYKKNTSVYILSAAGHSNYVQPSYPQAPRDIIVNNVSNGVQIKWNAPSFHGPLPITNYVIKRFLDNNLKEIYTTHNTNTSYTVLNLTHSIKYSFKVAAQNGNGIGTYSVSADVTPNIPSSNICFPGYTPISTDQGIIPIENINITFNTINNEKIFAITKTITEDQYLVCFEKNALGFNYPDKKTVMTKEHRVFYQGKWREANTFLSKFDKVKKIEYTGEILYNILMDKYSSVKVNKLLCETLHPNHFIAKLYKTPFSEEYKNKMIISMNDSIKRKDYHSYKKIVNRL